MKDEERIKTLTTLVEDMVKVAENKDETIAKLNETIGLQRRLIDTMNNELNALGDRFTRIERDVTWMDMRWRAWDEHQPEKAPNPRPCDARAMGQTELPGTEG